MAQRSIEARTTGALDDLVAALAYTDNGDNHYHISNGRELTIVSGLNDLRQYLAAEIEELTDDLDDPQIGRISNDTTRVEKIQVSCPVAPMTVTFRVLACDDPTCYTALLDYYL